MKSRVVPLILLPLAGFMFGWWTRGTAPLEPDPVMADRERGSHSRQSPVALESEMRPGKRPRVVEEEFTEADRRREEANRRRMQETCRRKLELMVAEWGRLLELNDAEMASLRGAIGPAMDGLDPPFAELAMPVLEETLRSMLDGDRAIALQQLGKRRQEALASARVEARLAEISAVLLLDLAQQVALRESLSEEAGRLPDPSRQAPPGLSAELLAEINRRLAVVADDSAQDDETAFRRITGEVVRENINADLDGLAEILSPDQLETYRQHLEEVNAQWLLPMP